MAPRLLRVCDLTFETSQEVPYAILSHRWSSQETSLADIKAGRAGSKVSDFARFVQNYVPGVEHIWVDTCCINQDSDSELSRSINRMFEYYRNATACIVFLQDVTHPSDTVSLRKSVWFTRGWTLQELLASTVIIFVTARWEVIGHKGKAAHLEMEVGPNIEVLLAERTMIPLDVLRDFSTSRLLSVDERLMWLEGRETQEEEDMYYSVFGIFGVFPGVNYGEGRRRARKRLVEAIYREHVSLEPDDHDRQQSAGQPDIADIEAWLTPADVASSHATAREQHGPGTCMWLLQHESYTSWKTGFSQHLWIHGKPGCGKTILCSTVIEDMRNHCQSHAKDVGLAYFYFTFSDDRKQSYDELILSLVAQFAARKSAHSALLASYKKSPRSPPVTRELEKILLSTVSTLDTVFLILDALDESPERSGIRQIMLQRLCLLLSNASNIRLLATSRYLPDIKASMEDLQSERIPMDASYVSIDIQRHVTTALAREPRLRQFTPAAKALIRANITDNADGMFRWADLLLNELRKIKNSAPKVILEALQRFPRALDDVYDRILREIPMENQRDASVLLTWITYATEPLTLGQLVEALAINHEHGTVCAEDRCQPEDVLWLLGSLVVITASHEDEWTYSSERYTKYRLHNDKKRERLVLQGTRGRRVFGGTSNDNQAASAWQHGAEGHLHHNEVDDRLFSIIERNDHDLPVHASTKIRLAHFTVQEYLESSRMSAGTCKTFHLERTQGHRSLTEGCIAYILHSCSTHEDSESSCSHAADLPLLDYARHTWSYHASRRGSTEACPELRLLDVEEVRRCWLRHSRHTMHIANADWYMANSALEVASYLGLLAVVKHLFANKDNIDLHSNDIDAALRQAACQEHVSIFKLLLKEGADINKCTIRGDPLLHIAAQSNRLNLAQLLLNNGANPDLPGLEKGGTALFHAARVGSIEMMQLLLQSNADPNAHINITPTTALEHAVWYKQSRKLKLLLDYGAEVNAPYSMRCNPVLFMASAGGSVEIVKLLLKHGADVNLTTDGSTALHRASESGHVAIVRLLLQNGADVDVTEKHEGSALAVAARYGRLAVMKLLLAASADIGAYGSCSSTALAAAARSNEIEAVKLLLASGADVNAYGGDRMSALHTASRTGNCDVLRLLLKSGAEINAKGGDRQITALHAASAEGHCKAIEVLLASGANINAKAADGLETSLTAASKAGHLEVVKMLIAAGAVRTVEGSFEVATMDHHSNSGDGPPLTSFGTINGIKTNDMVMAWFTEGARLQHPNAGQLSSDFRQRVRTYDGNFDPCSPDFHARSGSSTIS